MSTVDCWFGGHGLARMTRTNHETCPSRHQFASDKLNLEQHHIAIFVGSLIQCLSRIPSPPHTWNAGGPFALIPILGCPEPALSLYWYHFRNTYCCWNVRKHGTLHPLLLDSTCLQTSVSMICLSHMVGSHTWLGQPDSSDGPARRGDYVMR